MFGKVIAIGTYLQNILNVYQVRRFPSTKIPLFAINTSMVFFTIFAHRLYWDTKMTLALAECKVCYQKKCICKKTTK